MAETIPYSLLGTQVSGDLGGMTIYTNKNGRKVWFPAAPPDKPPSVLQIAHRARFAAAGRDWSAATADTKHRYEEIVHQLHIAMTGRNLWISIALRHDSQTLSTLERQSGITVPTPPFH